MSLAVEDIIMPVKFILNKRYRLKDTVIDWSKKSSR